MALTEQEALESARRYIKTIRHILPYPVRDVPVERSRSMDSDLPNAHLEGGPIGRDFWTFYFAYEVTGKLVDPSAARVLVDAITGNAALYLRPK